MATPSTVHLTAGETAVVRYAITRLREIGPESPDHQAKLLDSADAKLSGSRRQPRDVTRVCLIHDRSEREEQTEIDTEVWMPPGDGSGHLARVRRRTVNEVHALLRAAMEEPVSALDGYSYTTIEGAEEYFSAPLLDGDRDWPEGRTVVFPVMGSSEGDYVHVGVVDHDGKFHDLLLGKTFSGRDAAWAFARRVADLLRV
jgi:hypothetical protein